ncbi:MAG: T9SS type A sorting domain-containing protein [Bacteroidia bacterium]
MKKIYTLFLSACAFAAVAQVPKLPSSIDVPVKAQKFTWDVTPPSPVLAKPETNTPKHISLGKASRSQWVGFSQNDQQTNASVYRHIHVFDDGKVSITWTTSTDQAPFNTRGSGFNHFNGSVWGPVTSARIEPERTGFPEYVYNPTTNEEIILSHIVKASTSPTPGAAGGLLMNRKPGIGLDGNWTSTTVLDTAINVPGVLWNRSAVSGDYLIVVASYTDSSAQQPTSVFKNGVRAPTVYSRYQFSTNTWLVKNSPLPNYDNTRNRLGRADAYAIDSRGNNVAILMGGLTDDLTLWKSTDNGATWTTTVVDSFPVGAFNYKTQLLDTPYTNDGSVNVLLDANGKAHCFWGRSRVLDIDTTDEQISFYPGQNAIMYWNENKPYGDYQIIGGAPDINRDGQLTLGSQVTDVSARYGNNSLAFQPSATVDANGTIYCIYSAPNEEDPSIDNKNFRDIFLVYSTDGGNSWDNGILNLTGFLGFNLEQVHATLARRVDRKLHITFLQKNSIGRYDATNNPGAVGPYDIMYLSIDTQDVFAGTVTSLRQYRNDLFTIDQNYPNPFKTNTSIPVSFNRTTNANVKIVDLIGKEVFNHTFTNIPAGKSDIEVSLSGLPAGIYVYTVEAEGFKVSRKMMLE